MPLSTGRAKSKMFDFHLQRELEMYLGPGPMRFGPIQKPRSLKVEIKARNLTADQVKTFSKIRTLWETTCKKDAEERDFSSQEILRMAIFCGFDRRRTLNFMKNIEPRLFKLSATQLGGQLRTRTLFPCPGLKTRQDKTREQRLLHATFEVRSTRDSSFSHHR